jgi:hypothetical protein
MARHHRIMITIVSEPIAEPIELNGGGVKVRGRRRQPHLSGGGEVADEALRGLGLDDLDEVTVAELLSVEREEVAREDVVPLKILHHMKNNEVQVSTRRHCHILVPAEYQDRSKSPHSRRRSLRCAHHPVPHSPPHRPRARCSE